MLWDSCSLWRTSICPVYNSKEGKKKEKLVWCTILWSPALSQPLLWSWLPDGGRQIPEELQTGNLQENCLDKKRQHEDLKLWIADNTGQRHMTRNGLAFSWHDEDLGSCRRPRSDVIIVPNLVNTHRMKSSIRIIPKLLPLFKETLGRNGSYKHLDPTGRKKNALLFLKDRACSSNRSWFPYFLLNSGLFRTEELLHDTIHQWQSYREEDTRDKFNSSVWKHHPWGLKQDFPSQIPYLIEHLCTTSSIILLLKPYFKRR